MISSFVHRFLGRRTEENLAIFLIIALSAALLNAVYVLFAGLWQPLLDIHAFRQTQTALTAYWLAHGGPWLAYQTPVLGAPWSIPFEFPLYQWIVAIFAKAGVPLDVVGRIVAFAFYVGTLWPLSIFFRAVGLGRAAFLSTAILFMTAPLYLFWSRTFMIESCALFFSCLALALLASLLRRRRLAVALAATVAGIVATLVKSTTFPAFALVGGCLILIDLGRRLQDTRAVSELMRVVAPALVITVPLIVGYAWVQFTDHIKSANEFGDLLTSANLSQWNFGSMRQRLSLDLWNNTIQNRVLPDLFGPAVLIAAAAAGAALPRYPLAVILACVGFLVPFLVFTNLHIVHNYYQYANGIFALAAVGIGIGSLVDSRLRYRYLVGLVALAILVVAQIGYFQTAFWPQVVGDYAQNRNYRIAQLAKVRTPDVSSLIVIDGDWSSEIPYYSQRKSLALAHWFPPRLTAKVFKSPQAFLGDRPFGGVVFCADRLAAYGQRAPLIESFVAGRKVLGEFGGCQLLAPSRD